MRTKIWVLSNSSDENKYFTSERSESSNHRVKPIFHLTTLFARREAKTRIRQRDWLKLAGEKIRRQKNSPRTSRNRSYFFVYSREQIRQMKNRLNALFIM